MLDVCAGVSAASLAWRPLGWRTVAFSEIDRFACAVLAHRYPDVPNWGDMTRFMEWPDANVDVLCGGTPCQSYSLAGKRSGLDDPRGNLMLTYGAIARRYRPQWLVWENVPGVLSSWSDEADEAGRPTGWQRSDFDTFLAMLADIGYGFAYRVLDAQHAGLAQRRKRVFVVGCLGDWRRAAAVLFERASLRGDPAPSRGVPQDLASTIAGGARQRGGFSYDDIPQVTATLDANYGRLQGASGQDAKHGHSTLISGTLRAAMGKSTGSAGHPQAQAVAAHGVRRLTPTECERLMGMPDGYTAVPYPRKVAKDCPRYRAIGNSWAVPVVAWIGRRIQLVEGLT
jgi:DNA (cytosine-5)-methyltransferase 1